jgi:trehalose-6-phosphatase
MGKHVVMFLDYDDTLSQIVDDPDCAIMSEEVRKFLTQFLLDAIDSFY